MADPHWYQQWPFPSFLVSVFASLLTVGLHVTDWVWIGALVIIAADSSDRLHSVGVKVSKDGVSIGTQSSKRIARKRDESNTTEDTVDEG